MKLGEIIKKDDKKLSKHGYTSKTIMEELSNTQIPVKTPNNNAVVNLSKRKSDVTIVFNPRNHKEYKELDKLKGIQLEKLGNTVVVECLAKSYVINGKKNNTYIMESVDDGSKIRYDIDDLKYDYKRGKVKIFEEKLDDEIADNLGVGWKIPKGFLNARQTYVFFPNDRHPLYFHITGATEDGQRIQITYDEELMGRKPSVDSTIVSIDGLAAMYEDGRLQLADIQSNYDKPEDDGNWDEDV